MQSPSSCTNRAIPLSRHLLLKCIQGCSLRDTKLPRGTFLNWMLSTALNGLKSTRPQHVNHVSKQMRSPNVQFQDDDADIPDPPTTIHLHHYHLLPVIHSHHYHLLPARLETGPSFILLPRSPFSRLGQQSCRWLGLHALQPGITAVRADHHRPVSLGRLGLCHRSTGHQRLL